MKNHLSWTASTISLSRAFCTIVWKWQVAQLQRQPFLFSWNLLGMEQQFQHQLILNFLTFAINTLEYYYLWMYYGDFHKKSWFDGVGGGGGGSGEWIHSWSNSIFSLTMVSHTQIHAHAHAHDGNNVPWNNMFNIYFYCTNGFSYRIGPFLSTHTRIAGDNCIPHAKCVWNQLNTPIHRTCRGSKRNVNVIYIVYQTLKMKRIALDKGHTFMALFGCERWFLLLKWRRQMWMIFCFGLLVISLAYVCVCSEWENKTITINSEWRLHFRQEPESTNCQCAYTVHALTFGQQHLPERQSGKYISFRSFIYWWPPMKMKMMVMMKMGDNFLFRISNASKHFAVYFTYLL